MSSCLMDWHLFFCFVNIAFQKNTTIISRMDKSLASDAYNFLKNNFVVALATSHLNLPYVSNVYYTIDEKFNFYFVTKMNTDKYLNMKANKNVALAIGVGPKHIGVKVRGHATILKDEKWKNRILSEISSMLLEKGITDWPIKKVKDMQANKEDFN